MEPRILYEDEDILAVDKPSGMIVNKADTTKNELTLQEWAENYLKLDQGTLTHERDDFVNRGGVVHRLDKETSGVILLAKTPESFYNLQTQFKNRFVSKRYITLVHGVVKPKNGEISSPIGRLPWNRMRFGVVPDGREAQTQYITQNVLNLKSKTQDKLTLLEVYPKTGRTHQIRVHMKHLNHPVFADILYAGRKNARDDRKLLNRIFLHAEKITFINPKTNKEMTLLSPLPIELQNFLDINCEIIVEKN